MGLGDIDRVAGDTLNNLFYIGSMESGHHRMAGLHGAKGDISFFAPDFSYDEDQTWLPGLPPG